MKAAAKTNPPKFRIKKDDQVQVIAGKAKGEMGPVLRVDAERRRVYVKGLNLQQRHTKPRRAGEKGGIIPMEGPLHMSNVLLYCSNCKRGVRTRLKVVQKRVKSRICVKCGETIS
ncbi:MAG: 50S ribosomal protein L24 [bacterium]